LERGILPQERLSPQERALSGLYPAQLRDLLVGKNEIQTASHSFHLIREFGSEKNYRFVPKQKENQKLVLMINFVLIIASLGLFVFALFFFMRHRRLKVAVAKDRELVMQTLTHELRHPATSLQLSLEQFRDHFDSLPESVQLEFLRMCDQVSRLHRIIHASKQYLDSSATENNPFQFQFQTIDSMNAYVEDVISPYLAKVEFLPLAVDRGFSVDRYWTAMCLTNLVKNALAHGQQPVIVSIISNSDQQVEIQVQDSGTASTLDFSEMIQPYTKSKNSKGMGLGLSLVYRIANLLGGELIYSSQPTIFKLILRNEK
jgi:signal transduction histidine kinase